MALPLATPTTLTPPSPSGFGNEVAVPVGNGNGIPPLPPGSYATVAIEMMREITRCVLALVTVVGAYAMFFMFVNMAENSARERITFLVIGNLMTIAVGVVTWYFGAAMRSAIAALQQRIKGGNGEPAG